MLSDIDSQNTFYELSFSIIEWLVYCFRTSEILQKESDFKPLAG